MNIKLLFFPISLAVLLWAIIGYAKPSWDEYNIKKDEANRLIKERTELRNGIISIKQALLDYKNLDADTLTYVKNAIPGKDDSDNFIAEINKNALDSGILITKIDVAKGRKVINPKCKQTTTSEANKKQGINDKCRNKAEVSNVSVSAVGAYENIKDFLGKIDIQNRIISPVDINLSATKNRNQKNEEVVGTDIISAKLQFKIFKKEQKKNKVLSTIIKSDGVLKSLLNKGLDAEAIKTVNKFITSKVFHPVEVAGVGKSNLFEKHNNLNSEQ